MNMTTFNALYSICVDVMAYRGVFSRCEEK